MVLQSAMNALNPVFSIGAQLADVLRAHRPDMGRAARRDRAAQLLDMVGITADRLGSYPHELSGGMRQRVMIAMALALDPQMVIMDEPTTALDVVTQREILEELTALRDRLGFAVLFITHDLSLLIEIADSIAVMYGGPHRRAGAGHGAVPRAAAPLHAGPAQLLPVPARAPRAHERHPRLAAGPARPAGRVPVPPALPATRWSGAGPSSRRCDRTPGPAGEPAGRRVLAAGRLRPPPAELARSEPGPDGPLARARPRSRTR